MDTTSSLPVPDHWKTWPEPAKLALMRGLQKELERKTGRKAEEILRERRHGRQGGLSNQELEQRAQAQASLAAYVTQAWHILEPATVFVPNWHIDAMAEHLEAVSKGDILKLLITIPPRCIKSLLVAVFWPTWEWTRHPATRWLFSSYAMTLSTRDSLKCRRVIESPWYQKNWGSVFALTSDQNAKTRFENDKTGFRLATAVEAMATGEGGDRVICDDPHNVKEADSDTKRASVLTWWDEAMSTRLNDRRTGARVIIQQRVHHQDLAGHTLEKEGYVHLNLPMRYEEEQKCRIFFPEKDGGEFYWEDPRTKEGELLWPERFTEADVAELEADLGSHAAAGQLQQRPTPRGGGMIKRAWFPIVEAAPVEGNLVRWWDLAATEEAAGKDPDWTAGAKVLKTSAGIIYVVDMQHFRESPFNVEARIKQTTTMDGRTVTVWMEQEPGSAGKNTIATYSRLLGGYDFHGERSTGAKEVAIRPFAAQAEAGNVRLVKGPWNEAFLQEAETFPSGKHDDMIESASKAYLKLCTDIPTVAPVGIKGTSKWKM